MKISIIIPVYNVAQYIEECLDSVIAQTYTGDMECLIVDDCGTDDSMAIAGRIIQGYQGNIKFQVLHHEHNRGLSAARNTGIEASTGDYMYFLDSDDTIIPECIELMVDMLKKHPKAEIIQAGANSENKSVDIETKKLPEYSDDRQWISQTFLEGWIIPVTSWNKLIKKEFLYEYSLSFREGLLHEDELFNFYLAKYVSYIAFVKKNTYNYRTTRVGSIMQGMKMEVSNESWLRILEECINHIDKDNRKHQTIMIFKHLHYKYVFSFNEKHRKKAKELLFLLSHYTNIIGLFTVFIVIYMPNNLNRKKILYTRFIEHYLVNYF